MATLDTLMHEILSPVEMAMRHAPKVLGWLETPPADAPSAQWEWLDAAAPVGVEVTECQLPEDLLRALFNTCATTAH